MVMVFTTSALPASNWFKTSTGDTMAAGTWSAASTGSCTGSGATLTWADRTAGDRFYANGCATTSINADPGVSGVQVNLDNSNGNGATAGGTYTITLAAMTLAVNGLNGNATELLAVTGNTAGLTIGVAGSTFIAGAGHAINDTHTVVAVNYVGNFTGGSASTAYGLRFYSSSGSAAVTGVCTGTTGAGCVAFGTAPMTVTAASIFACVGGSTAAAYAGVGCSGPNSGGITITGSLKNGTKSAATAGYITWTPRHTGTTWDFFESQNGTPVYASVPPATSVVLSPNNFGAVDGSLYQTGVASAGAGGGAWGF